MNIKVEKDKTKKDLNISADFLVILSKIIDLNYLVPYIRRSRYTFENNEKYTFEILNNISLKTKADLAWLSKVFLLKIVNLREKHVWLFAFYYSDGHITYKGHPFDVHFAKLEQEAVF